jgi:chemotaxis protein methyltransferase CheR
MALADDAPDGLDRLIALVGERTRLRITPRNVDILHRCAQRRMQALGQSLSEYVSGLADSTPFSGELEQITRELTVGETYFFRGPQLEEVREHLLPRIIERRRLEQSRILRILSAGCATGEEAYSVVMVLSELLPDFADWHVNVLGLDINRQFLARAERASYTDWSLRDVPAGVVEQHFERRDGRFEVKSELRRKVRFQYFNLALDPLPAPALGAMGMDLVLCQNVLYYFEPDARDSVADRLAHCLRPQGYLVLGPADMLGKTVSLCRARTYDDFVTYQRVERVSTRPGPPSSRPARALHWPIPAPPPSDVASAPPQSAPADETLDSVFTRANDGDLPGGIDEMRSLLAQDRERPDLHALHGFLLTESGEFDGALEAFRRATYLDPNLLLAHAGAAMTARRAGRDDLARRARARVRSLAQQQPADRLVVGWEGMTVGRLLRLFDENADGLLAEAEPKE